MIDLEKEATITLAEAARRLPKTTSGRPVHVKTVARWVLHGVRGGICLESVLIGGRRVTSVEACKRFFAALTGGHVVGQKRKKVLSDAEVKAQLKARGYKV